MKLKGISLCFLAFCLAVVAMAQTKGLTNTTKSPYAKMHSVDLSDVTWTKGFWAERFDVCKDTMLYNMWRIFDNPELSHAYRNFEIAAGLKEGEHKDPPFFDGDMYKWLEGAAAVYAITKDPKLDALMDRFIETIRLSQREDGYIHTATIVADKNNPGAKKGFEERLHFETYNMGHLMTAGCVHYRVTGKRTLLDLAIKTTDFLYNFYKTATNELARSAICPSHYMGVVEMYRTTRDPKYLELSKSLIDIRGMVENGTDDNQDRIPFREQKVAMGHAVRANYLYAGVADVYLETGDKTLLECLHPIWNDVTYRKMYITGGCGALYDGTSPDGTAYEPDSIQKVHQSYGRAYQLPQETAHNETCANIGNMLWNFRMLQLSADSKYADIMEQTYYNSILSGISLDGKKYFYTNALSHSHEFPYQMRWGNFRQEYITCFCCPPNTVRTIAEANSSAYATSHKGVYCNLYGGNTLRTKAIDGSDIHITQTTDYPWDGNVTLKVEKAPKGNYSIFLRVPEWSESATVKVNGKEENIKIVPGSYAEVNRQWKNGDMVELIMPFEARLVEANPMVEESRNQIAVMYGPLVYCMEAKDLPEGVSIYDILIPTDIKLTPKAVTIENSKVVMLTGKARLLDRNKWTGKLYRKVNTSVKDIEISLIPYYAWNNRGNCDMSVWLRAAN
ncbi:glycoside hydrolase family 127 protein [Dysgonomonas sp. 511]|uniref:aceric acid hydrolase n=1 Tax=Dysgonomonas sp. 511 TaxID=2302930 RepID=UPI0013D85CFC|nr:glycoside hydrolase family 127 protein [Dysgonomonas sp. 511]NDV78092.1 glycoside hydrolase family 127 protein [Dysgonomonas sp. 511]